MSDAVPAARSSPPPPSTSCARQVWKVFKIVVAVVYLFLATLFSIFASSLVPRIGPPIAAHLPADSVLALHLKNGNEAWATLEEHPGVQALWAHPEFQRRTKLREKWEKAQRNWREKRGDWFFQLDRPGLGFALGGELAVAVQRTPPGTPDKGEAPGVIFGRVQGARGGLLRLVFWIQRFDKKKKDEHPRLLGGDLVALETHGGAAATPGSGLPRMPVPSTAVGFVHAQRDLLQALPDVWDLTGVTAPERIQLYIEPFGEGGLSASGEWTGKLPAPEQPGPLPAPELAEGATPLLDLTAPLAAREAFLRWVENEMSKGGRKEYRWQMRMGRLAEAGIDLNRDLWPHCGHTLRLQLLPPPEASPSPYAAAVFSIPFKGPASESDPPFAALLAFGRAYANQCFEGVVPPDADRPYFIHRRNGPVSRLVWVKSSVLRPTFYVNPLGFAFISDAGPMAATPVAPGLGTPEEPPRCIFSLKADGVRLAPHLGSLKQMQLEDLRDDLGAAEFLRRVPDERAVVGFVEKVSRMVGHLKVEVRANPAADGQGDDDPASVRLEWLPKLE